MAMQVTGLAGLARRTAARGLLLGDGFPPAPPRRGWVGRGHGLAGGHFHGSAVEPHLGRKETLRPPRRVRPHFRPKMQLRTRRSQRCGFPRHVSLVCFPDQPTAGHHIWTAWREARQDEAAPTPEGAGPRRPGPLGGEGPSHLLCFVQIILKKERDYLPRQRVGVEQATP